MTSEKKLIELYESMIRHIDTEIGNLIQFRNDTHKELERVREDHGKDKKNEEQN